MQRVFRREREREEKEANAAHRADFREAESMVVVNVLHFFSSQLFDLCFFPKSYLYIALHQTDHCLKLFL